MEGERCIAYICYMAFCRPTSPAFVLTKNNNDVLQDQEIQLVISDSISPVVFLSHNFNIGPKPETEPLTL